MKKILFTVLTLALSLTLAVFLLIPVSAVTGEQNGDSLSVVQQSGGAYVIITNLCPGDLDFNYGWNNAKQFETAPLGYWLGVYDITASGYVWSGDHQLSEPNPKMLKESSLNTDNLITGHEYAINFFVRDAYDAYGGAISNVTIVQVYFTAP